MSSKKTASNRHIATTKRAVKKVAKSVSRSLGRSHIAALSAVLLTGVVGLALIIGARAAGPVDIYISPATGNYTTDGTVTVTFMLNTHGAEVVGGSISATYPSSVLQCQSITESSSFPNSPIVTCTGGNVNIQYANYDTNQTGVVPVATAVFDPLVAGTADITLGGDSVAYDIEVNDVTNSRSNASYTIANPTPPPTTDTPPSTSNGGTTNTNNTNSTKKNNTSTTPAPAPAAAAPKIQNFALVVEKGQLKASWKTDQESTSILRYGLSDATLEYSAQTEGSITEHLVLADMTTLPAGSVVFARGTSANSAGLSSDSEIAQVTLPVADDQKAAPTFTVTVKSGDKLANGAEVAFTQDGVTQKNKTKTDGVAKFNILADGEATITATLGKKKATQKVTVATEGGTRAVTLQLASRSVTKTVGVALAALAVLGAIGYAVWWFVIKKGRGGGGMTSGGMIPPDTGSLFGPSGPPPSTPVTPAPGETIEHLEQRVAPTKGDPPEAPGAPKVG